MIMSGRVCLWLHAQDYGDTLYIDAFPGVGTPATPTGPNDYLVSVGLEAPTIFVTPKTKGAYAYVVQHDDTTLGQMSDTSLGTGLFCPPSSIP